MNASMRTVPIASKKLFMTGPLGRDDASDVRTEPLVLMAQVMLPLDAWL
jgi:hypothetical protein